MNKKKTKSYSVAPSPLNPVKLELAVVIIMLGVFFLLVDSITEDLLVQLSVLFAAGVGGMIWIISRTRATVKNHLQDKNN